MAVPKQTTFVELDLTGIKGKAEAKRIAGDIITDSILLDSANQRSSVTGRNWKSLTDKNYIKKKGTNLADLRLEGKLMSSLKSQNRAGSNIEVGIFKASEQGKSDGHNNLSGRSKLPPRQFIPDEGESFRAGIQKEVDTVLDLLREDDVLAQALGRLLK